MSNPVDSKFTTSDFSAANTDVLIELLSKMVVNKVHVIFFSNFIIIPPLFIFGIHIFLQN